METASCGRCRRAEGRRCTCPKRTECTAIRRGRRTERGSCSCGNAYDRENSGFDSGQTPNADLMWIPAEGGDVNLILPARGAGAPHFTHDKDRIYVYTPQGLVSLRYDGTDRRTHLQVKGQGLYFFEEPIAADDIQASPDGQWALAHVMNQLYLLPLPQAAGEA